MHGAHPLPPAGAEPRFAGTGRAGNCRKHTSARCRRCSVWICRYEQRNAHALCEVPATGCVTPRGRLEPEVLHAWLRSSSAQVEELEYKKEATGLIVLG